MWNGLWVWVDVLDRLLIPVDYSAILRSRTDSLRSRVILQEWLAFYSAFFFNSHRSGVLTELTWLVPRETAAVSARSVYTIQHVGAVRDERLPESKLSL